METKFNPCLSLKPYIDYWDEWHNEWYINASSKPPILTSIKGWPIPTGNSENKNDIWCYFPEPYWGNPNPIELTAVFLNLNPGEGGECQNILSSCNDNSHLYNTYQSCNRIYSRTVSDLIKDNCYITTNWFIKKRVSWLNNLSENLNSNYSIDNILCADLIPWHTPKVSQVRAYIKRNQHLILNRVIIPITEISQCAEFKGLVFAKGAEIEHIISKGLQITPTKYEDNKKFRISIFDYNGAKIIVFIGGQGMSLPQPLKKYLSPISHNNVSVASIVNGCLINNYV